MLILCDISRKGVRDLRLIALLGVKLFHHHTTLLQHHSPGQVFEPAKALLRSVRFPQCAVVIPPPRPVAGAVIGRALVVRVVNRAEVHAVDVVGSVRIKEAVAPVARVSGQVQFVPAMRAEVYTPWFQGRKPNLSFNISLTRNPSMRR